MHRFLALLVLASLAIAPVSAASEPAPAGAPARWALDHARHAGGSATAHLAGDIACPLGDVNADGAADLLLRVRDATGESLQALAGPAYVETLWTIELSGSTQLTCAPDADLDGIADPVLEAVQDAQGELPGAPGVDAANADATLRAFAGATGKALVDLTARESARGGGAAAAGGWARTDVTLEPAGAGVYLFVATEETAASASLPLEDLILSGGDAEVRIQAVDATGKVTGTIEAPEGSDILAHAGVPDLEGARVLVLSATEASPLDQLPARVPTASMHAVDGSVVWSTRLEATTGVLMLLPRAGDIDGDGVEDLIAQSMPADFGLDGASAIAVLSGADGSILLERATPTGLLAALPLGDLTPELPDDAEALLVVVQERADAPLTLECVREGASCWTAQLPASAHPVNGILDPFTGDLVGFTDLTGDGVPDVAAMVEEKGEATLRALSGADGSLAWSVSVDASAHVHAVPLEGGADLVLLIATAQELVVTLLDGVDGSVAWSVAGENGSLGTADLDVQSVLDDAGNAESLLVTARDAAGGELPTERVYEIDPKTGSTKWSGTTDAKAGVKPPALELQETDADPRPGIPGPSPMLVAAAAVGAVLAARWMRRAPKA